ncbi:Beta-crystallin A2, partial [Pelecanus crispus]
ITVWEEENFQGKRCEFLMECPSIMERGFRKIRSIKVESGPWVGFEYPEYQGQQFILEKGDYPRWEAWSGNSGYRTEHLLSFRPVKCAGGAVGWRGDCTHWLLPPCKDPGFLGLKFSLKHHPSSFCFVHWRATSWAGVPRPCPPTPDTQGWVNAGAWVAYQYPGYRGYQYVLERDRQNGEFKKYNEYSSQAHTNQIQSIRRIQH